MFSPTTAVTMSLATENVKKSSFGFNAGAGVELFLRQEPGRLR